MIDVEHERMKFERHITAKCDSEEYAILCLQRATNGEYTTTWVKGEWDGWIAAKQDAAPSLPFGWRERAVRACEAERVDAESSGTSDDLAYNNAISHCIAAIRTLDACSTCKGRGVVDGGSEICKECGGSGDANVQPLKIASDATAELLTLKSSSPEEMAAFDSWAARRKYDMTTHPLHRIFQNERTHAARQAWKAGLAFAYRAVLSVLRRADALTPDVMTSVSGDRLHPVVVTSGELITIRDAVREYRTVAPQHIASDPSKLKTWQEYREDFAPERARLDSLTTELLASEVDETGIAVLSTKAGADA